MIFVRKKKYDEVCDEVCGAMLAISKVVDALALDLVRERKRRAEQEELNRMLTADGEKAFEEIQVERRRADHFQSRCEIYEDAAKDAGMEFVPDEDGFFRLREKHYSAEKAGEKRGAWAERLKNWP